MFLSILTFISACFLVLPGVTVTSFDHLTAFNDHGQSGLCFLRRAGQLFRGQVIGV